MTTTSIGTLQHQIGARNKIAQIIFGLYRIAHHYEAVFRKKEYYQVHSLFAGIAFSMWRAAFLTSQHGSEKVAFEHCVKFLRTLTRDNAINFAQDREMSDWSVGYYLTNAVFRLHALSKFKLCRQDKELQKFSKVDFLTLVEISPVTKERDTTREWDRIYDVLESSYLRFQKAVYDEYQKNYS